MVRKSALVHPWREPVAPKPAATILLLRDAPGGLEVLMTRRSSTASFAPGAFVFPGGALDEADRAAAGTRSVRARADQDLEQQSFAAAALREAYEELGVLLAYRQDHAQLCEGSELPHLARHGDDDFYQRLDAAGLQLAVDRAFWLSHWITDRDLPKRFDARFFVAQMPPGYAPVADDGETFEPTWVVPAEGLQRHERGEFNIIYPTIRTLRQLCRYRSVADLLESLRGSRRIPVSCPRAGYLRGSVERYTSDEPPYGELELVVPDGQLIHRLDWQSEEPVSLLRHVRRLTAPNGGMMTGPGTNTYIVGQDELLVIDPGPPVDEHVQRLIALVGDRLKLIVCTHSHPDHSPGAAMLKQATGVPVLGLASGPNAPEHSRFAPDRELNDGERLRVDDSTLRVVHTPGHAANHLCLVLEEDRLLFSGDHILNGSTTVVNPPDGDMKAYLESLDRLAREPVDYILPAHGYVLAPAADAIQRLIAHRLAREAKVVAALEQAGEGTLETLVPRVYDDVSPALHAVAMRSLLAHLQKLQAERRASESGARWRLG